MPFDRRCREKNGTRLCEMPPAPSGWLEVRMLDLEKGRYVLMIDRISMPLCRREVIST